jgi:putative tryptophan/tyrosine transport system substrate-binding protein
MRFDRLKRREFITLVGGAAAWPVAARAQQVGRVRRIGVLIPYAEDDPQSSSRVAALKQGLEKVGWIAGRNLTIDYRWEIDNNERARTGVAELLKLAPDLLVTSSVPATSAAHEATQTVPIIFNGVSEPVALGFVASLAHPGRNMTGFTNLEPSVGSKWIELLKEIAPGITGVAFMYREYASSSIPLFVRAMEAAAQKLALDAAQVLLHGPDDIEPAMAKLGSASMTGLVLPLDGFTGGYYALISRLAARERLPAIYPLRQFATVGGLVSYGPDLPDQFRRGTVYIDRILKGEKPADLPVQPNKYELVINLKTAKALGLSVPQSLLVAADEVIE